MLLSHRHRFIFIKTVKTAGTSIEVDLSQHMGDEDIVTEIGSGAEGHRPRNNVGFYNHMSALEVRDRIGRLRFWRYFKFCVEREPIDNAFRTIPC